MVTLEKITSDAPIAKVMELRQFLDKILRYEENGFEWPKSLMDAHNIEALRKQLAEVEARERPTPELLARHRVPQEIFWIHNEDKAIVGMLKLRTMLTPGLLYKGGHIGYGIAPEFRQRGYAKAALQKALEYCRYQHQLHDILLTVHCTNLASRNTIESVGGKEWDMIPESATMRYWIHC